MKQKKHTAYPINVHKKFTALLKVMYKFYIPLVWGRLKQEQIAV